MSCVWPRTRTAPEPLYKVGDHVMVTREGTGGTDFRGQVLKVKTVSTYKSTRNGLTKYHYGVAPLTNTTSPMGYRYKEYDLIRAPAVPITPVAPVAPVRNNRDPDPSAPRKSRKCRKCRKTRTRKTRTRK